LYSKVGTPIIVVSAQGMFMNKLRLMVVCALVIVTLLASISALADETRISPLTTLSNTSISGEVISTVTFTIQPSPQTPHVFRQRLYSFYFALRSHWVFLLIRY